MRNSVVRSISDSNPPEEDVLSRPVVASLLNRPRTAAPSVHKSSKQKVSGSHCSITVIGRQVVKDSRYERVGSALPSKSSRKDLLEPFIGRQDSPRPDSSDNKDPSINNVSTTDDLKSVSSKPGKSCFSSDVIVSLPKAAARPLPRNNSFSDSLSITSGPVTLLTRPTSSVPNQKGSRLSRPKTAAAIVHRRSDPGFCRLALKEANETVSASTDSPEKEAIENVSSTEKPDITNDKNDSRIQTQTTEEVNSSSNEVNFKDVTSKPPSDNVAGNEGEREKESVLVVKDTDTKLAASKCADKSGATSEVLASNNSEISSTSGRLPIPVEEENKSLDHSAGRNDHCGNVTLGAEDDASIYSTSTPRDVVCRTTAQERALSPVRCISTDLKHADDSHSVRTRTASVRSQSTASVTETQNTRSVTPKPGAEREITTPHPPPLSIPYTMAKVELFDRWSPRQPRLSIAEEIRRQNMMLEEKNSEFRHAQEMSEKAKFNQALENKDRERAKSGVAPADKGNVCGSPGYKAMQGQLRNATLAQSNALRNSLKLGTNIKSSQEAGKKLMRDVTLSVDKDKKLVALRPLSDYISRESQESLFVSGGGFKTEERSGPSKISVQNSNNTNENDMNDNFVHTLGNQKVRVSLAFLKEKNGLSSVAFRHRLDAGVSSASGPFSGEPSFCVKNANTAPNVTGCFNDLNQPNESSNTAERQNDARDAFSACNRKLTPRTDVNQNSNRALSANAGTEESSSEPLDSQPESSPADSSSSTPTAAFSGSDLLYGTDGLPRTSTSNGDDLGASDIAGYERDRQRLRDLEIGNKRPPSRSKRASYALVDKVSFDRERDDGRVLSNSLPAKTPTFRNNGIRSNLVRGEQLLTQRPSGSNSGRESDDLVAMGTLWSPANNNVAPNNNSGGSSSGPNTRSSSTTTASNKSGTQNGSSNNNNSNNNSNQKKPVSMSMSSGRLNHSSSFNGLSNVTLGRQQSNNSKTEDPKYPDPIIGAPASFQQRLMELASLEAETIRWERIKKVKKKPRQDRDS